MRRFLAIVGLVLAIAGFVMIPISLFYNINFLVPVGLVLAAFLILTYLKRMPSELDEKEPSSGHGSDPALEEEEPKGGEM